MSEAEYWEPESLVARLVVGARVRVRNSGECFSYHNPYCSHNHLRHNGEMGRILQVIRDPFEKGRCLECSIIVALPRSRRGHDFWVEFAVGDGVYAVAELEPLP